MISVGIFVAGLLQTILVAFGLGKLMQAMPAVAWAIKAAGALYLAWLGLGLLKAWFRTSKTATQSPISKTLSHRQLLYRGLLNNLLNPKALLFFSMFLP
ncbi:hypothetical protein NBRC116587_10330 [Pseudoteredinibacter isoporae]